MVGGENGTLLLVETILLQKEIFSKLRHNTPPKFYHLFTYCNLFLDSIKGIELNYNQKKK